MEKWNKKIDYFLFLLAFISLLVALYLTFIYSRIEKEMGIIQKIFYFHVPGAWVAFLAFFIVFIASILFLKNKDIKMDIISHASAEVGIYFCTITLITGPIWGRIAWGKWWDWLEPRLDTYLVLWALYIGYLVLRNAVEDDFRRARFAAVYGIVAFADVPLVIISILFLRKFMPHPGPIIFSRGGLTPDMKLAFFVSLFAFTVLFILLLRRRIFLLRIEEEIKNLKNKLGR